MLAHRRTIRLHRQVDLDIVADLIGVALQREAQTHLRAAGSRLRHRHGECAAGGKISRP